MAEFLYQKQLFVSVITQMEVLSYSGLTNSGIQQIQEFLYAFEIIELTHPVQEQTIKIRRSTRLKLPDSIIAATALALRLPFVSADKQFRTVPELDFVLYER